MDRRKSLKAMFAGTVTSGFMFTSCLTDTEKSAETTTPVAGDSEEASGYGRTPEEAARDKDLMSTTFFNEHEMITLAIVADIIIPADETSGSATDAKVPEFIEFIVKDMPHYQTPVRGGLRWLDYESKKRFSTEFKEASEEQRLEIIEDIAYPEEVKPELEQGARSFATIRNLVCTGFFTSEIGIKDIGYMGNVPNVWDGVPDDVLKAHGVAYDERILSESIKPEERNEVANWDNYNPEG
ncbi:gluconate 2-dehydrogenase subunit 3 family protein [Robertkochia solimangrovi]|uniref:gluconate 2-dehydrogenase subunit 3 family protein n=1 Tax=Robertkochia solimangrovi TaxID=2213046 RepID=UPI00117EA8CB|nr:gluconate 2-dehydrogenase subunit 3 family protein [Robertkochia solimangrovi]TRZ46318.1 gluconate 2-dehydrogenase subunit 3 family protein [Robertkochia solimangrovi]